MKVNQRSGEAVYAPGKASKWMKSLEAVLSRTEEPEAAEAQAEAEDPRDLVTKSQLHLWNTRFDQPGTDEPSSRRDLRYSPESDSRFSSGLETSNRFQLSKLSTAPGSLFSS